MRALSIRQPFAELILRGIKTLRLRSGQTVEYRAHRTPNTARFTGMLG
ncbi:MAG TPA: hypothetical protein VHS31_10230 [Tepidisphaeraceae bacterium]|nr:hypothetical protein [Tepidisphaeraceae bacterium]